MTSPAKLFRLIILPFQLRASGVDAIIPYVETFWHLCNINSLRADDKGNLLRWMGYSRNQHHVWNETGTSLELKCKGFLAALHLLRK